MEKIMAIHTHCLWPFLRGLLLFRQVGILPSCNDYIICCCHNLLFIIVSFYLFWEIISEQTASLIVVLSRHEVFPHHSGLFTWLYVITGFKPLIFRAPVFILPIPDTVAVILGGGAAWPLITKIQTTIRSFLTSPPSSNTT